jgi:hypothetical protein
VSRLSAWKQDVPPCLRYGFPSFDGDEQVDHGSSRALPRRPEARIDTSADKTQFIFMIGTGRCGSTQLAQIIASHSRVGFVSNIERRLPSVARRGRWNNFLIRTIANAAQFKELARVHDGAAKAFSGTSYRARALVGPSEAYDLLSTEVSSMISVPCRDLTADDAFPWVKERFRRFFALRAKEQDTPVFMHKFTGWPRARFVDATFPDAKFIHLVRDGRAVANSLMQVRFWRGYRGSTNWDLGPLPAHYAREWEESGRSFALLAGLEWKTLMDAFEEAERAIPEERWLNVRYEDFISEPRRALHEILAFIGLPWSADIEGQLRAARIMPARRQAYLTELSGRDVALLNQSLRTHLDRWGYGETDPGS